MIQQVPQTIEDIETLPVRIEYVAEVPSKWAEDKPCNVDQWRVSVTGPSGYWSTDYFTGLGLRTPAVVRRDIGGRTYIKAPAKIKKPSIASVMHCLLIYASAADENFNDWCANFGYSDDSLKALNTYKQCLEVGTALRRHFSPATLSALRDLLQDY
jgi:hypothetical protein